MSDLVLRIRRLPDQAAIEALTLVARWGNPEVTDIRAVADDEERRFRYALADPQARRDLESRAVIDPAPGDSSDLRLSGDLARSALVCLVEQDPGLKEVVARAIDRPAPVGARDPLTLMTIGIVVLALRPVIDIRYDRKAGWSFRLKTEPLKDSSMAKVIGKLLSAAFPNSSDR